MARNLGTYAIREFLISSWPTADVGDYAIVEKTATVYRYTPEGWIDSGSPADSIGKDYTAESEGTGEGDVFKEQVGTAFKFRSIKAGTNVTVVESDGEITISSAGSEWEGWSGKVATFNLLPDATEHDNEVWLVLQSSGVPILNYHSDGLYVSTGTAWDFLGPVPDAYMDTVFRVYNNTDGSKQIAFDASHVGTGQTRTITMPDKNIDLTDAVFSDSPSSTVGNVLISDNVDGRHLSDSGIASSKLVQGDSDTATVGHVATISNVDGKHVSDSGIVSADLIISDIASTVDGDFLVCNSTTGRHAKVLGSAEVSLSQYITIDITSADGTVPSYKYRGVILTGSLPANRIVTLPTAIYGMDVINNCTGAYYVTIKTAAGTGVISYGNDRLTVYCDGTNIGLVKANENLPVGIERRTADYFAGYPVYAKKIDTGSLPNATTKTTPHGITGAFTAIAHSGTAWTAANVSIPLPHVSNVTSDNFVTIIMDATNVIAITTQDRSSYSKSHITIKYVKVAP
jgi:hypothetical protein